MWVINCLPKMTNKYSFACLLQSNGGVEIFLNNRSNFLNAYCGGPCIVPNTESIFTITLWVWFYNCPYFTSLILFKIFKKEHGLGTRNLSSSSPLMLLRCCQEQWAEKTVLLPSRLFSNFSHSGVGIIVNASYRPSPIHCLDFHYLETKAKKWIDMVSKLQSQWSFVTRALL